MIQIVIWMLCVYLVLKGAELRGIAMASTHESRGRQLVFATVWAVIAWIAAAFFFWISIVQGSSMPTPPSNPYGGY